MPFPTFPSWLEVHEQSKMALETLRGLLGSFVLGALTKWMDVDLFILLFGCVSSLLVAPICSHPT